MIKLKPYRDRLNTMLLVKSHSVRDYQENLYGAYAAALAAYSIATDVPWELAPFGGTKRLRKDGELLLKQIDFWEELNAGPN